MKSSCYYTATMGFHDIINLTDGRHYIMKKYIIALDQGTTSSRAIIFDKKQNIVSVAQTEFTQYYPKSGWVEHDPMEIWATQSGVLQDVIARSGIAIEEIDSIGITNQRETTIIWDKKTGKPIYNAIVWQCRRTADIARKLVADNQGPYIKETTGLEVDAYFSGTKIKWILDHVEGAREKANRGELMFGTVDTWLLYNFTQKKIHMTDVTNASRTLLFDIKNLRWDEKLCELMDVPMNILPEVKMSSTIYGYINIQGHQIPIAGIAGDQQAALFGQTAFDKGDAKNTYGTGCFLLMNTGDTPVLSKNGLLTTIAIGLNDKVQYALEGSIFVGGAVIQWLRDEMGLIQNAAESESYAKKVKSTEGVYLVPAFTGLGAPHWDMYARGSISGMTRGTKKEHIIRAALESIAYQSYDVLKAMEIDSETPIQSLLVDGGASNNDFLMQFQSDILNIEVNRPIISETTALGAAYLAGLATGFFKDKKEIKNLHNTSRNWQPMMDDQDRQKLLSGWHKAIERALDWES